MKQEGITTDERNEPKRSKSRWWSRLILAFLILTIFMLVTPAMFGRLDPATRVDFYLKQMSLGLHAYEDTNKKFPPHLEDIFADEFTGQITFDECFERSPKMKGLWWYNVGIAELGDSSHSDAPHLVSPSLKGKRAILRIDQIVEEMTDYEALKIITDQDSTWEPIMGTE